MILQHGVNKQILIPPMHLNGFLCLSNSCIFHYKLCYKGKYFDVSNQISLKWNDKRINIKWPQKKNLIMSKRDR